MHACLSRQAGKPETICLIAHGYQALPPHMLASTLEVQDA
jgi:hypothetical protein